MKRGKWQELPSFTQYSCKDMIQSRIPCFLVYKDAKNSLNMSSLFGNNFSFTSSYWIFNCFTPSIFYPPFLPFLFQSSFLEKKGSSRKEPIEDKGWDHLPLLLRGFPFEAVNTNKGMRCSVKEMSFERGSGSKLGSRVRWSLVKLKWKGLLEAAYFGKGNADKDSGWAGENDTREVFKDIGVRVFKKRGLEWEEMDASRKHAMVFLVGK